MHQLQLCLKSLGTDGVGPVSNQLVEQVLDAFGDTCPYSANSLRSYAIRKAQDRILLNWTPVSKSVLREAKKEAKRDSMSSLDQSFELARDRNEEREILSRVEELESFFSEDHPEFQHKVVSKWLEMHGGSDARIQSKVIANMKEVLTKLNGAKLKSNAALDTVRTILGAGVGSNVKNAELNRCWGLEITTFQDLLQQRMNILEGSELEFRKERYRKSGRRFGDEVKKLCTDWHSHDDASYDDLLGRKVEVVKPDGSKQWEFVRLLYAIDEDANYEEFAAHPEFGLKCREITGRIPSSWYLEKHRPKRVCKFVEKLMQGADDVQTVMHRNWKELRKHAAMKDPQKAALLPPDAIHFARTRVCVSKRHSNEIHACEDNLCEECSFHGYFLKVQDDAKSPSKAGAVSKTTFTDSFGIEFDDPTETMVFWEYVKEEATEQKKKWKFWSLTSKRVPTDVWLRKFEVQCARCCRHINVGAKQTRALKAQTENVPPGTALIRFDYSTNFKERDDVFLTMEQWRASPEKALENAIVHYRLSDKTETDEDAPDKLEEVVHHFTCDEPKHSPHTHNINFQKLWWWLQYMLGLLTGIHIVTDGSPKEYKCVESFVLDKNNAMAYGVPIMRSFTPTGFGKGKVDLMGATLIRSYYRHCVNQLKSMARSMAAVVEWFNANRAIPKAKRKESRLKQRVYHHITKEEVHVRSPGGPSTWDSLKLNGRLPCTRSNYCFLVTPSTRPDDFGVWVRRYTCTSCDQCKQGNWLQCTNQACGAWKFVPFWRKGKKRRAENEDGERKKKKPERYVCPHCQSDIQNKPSTIRNHEESKRCKRARGLFPSQH